MTDLLPLLTNDAFLKAVTMVGVFVSAFALPGIGWAWYALRVKQWEMSLKHSMIERGMSAEEIKMVLEATSKDGPPKDWCNHSRGGGTQA